MVVNLELDAGDVSSIAHIVGGVLEQDGEQLVDAPVSILLS